MELQNQPRFRIFDIRSPAALTRANPGTHSDSSPTSATNKVITDNASVPNLHPMIRTTRVSGLTEHDRKITRPAIQKRRISPPSSEGPQPSVRSWSGALPSHDLSPQPEHRLEELRQRIPRYGDDQRRSHAAANHQQHDSGKDPTQHGRLTLDSRLNPSSSGPSSSTAQCTSSTANRQSDGYQWKTRP